MAFFDLYCHLLAAMIIAAALVDRAVEESAARRPRAPAGRSEGRRAHRDTAGRTPGPGRVSPGGPGRDRHAA
jgi:hypothetical protein